MTRPGGPGGPGRGRRLATTAALLVAGVLVVVGVVGIVQQGERPPATPSLPDLRGNRVDDAAPGLAPSPAAVRRMAVRAADGDAFRVPSVGLDVPLRSLVTVDHEVQPPTFTDAFWIRDLGLGTGPDPGRARSSSRCTPVRGGGVGPGNALYDTASGTSRVGPATPSRSRAPATS